MAAAALVKQGRVFAMGIPLNNQGPQSGLFGGRWNPIHTMARHKGVDWLADGYGISNAELDATAEAQGVSVGRGDFVILRTGQMGRCRAEGRWGGYAGGDAPGVRFENCYWCQEKQIAAICSDTWGVEVRPNETDQAKQP